MTHEITQLILKRKTQMNYNQELAKKICKESGINWDTDANCASVAGKPILSYPLTATDVFVFTPESAGDLPCCEQHSEELP